MKRRSLELTENLNVGGWTNINGKITADAFYGDGSNLTGVGQTPTTTDVTGDYTLLITDELLKVQTGCTITIPSSVITSKANKQIIIKDFTNNASVDNITIETEGTEKIEFSTDDYVIDDDGYSLTLLFDVDIYII